MLGEPDRGFRVAMHTLNLFRPSVGAFAVGIRRRRPSRRRSPTRQRREAFGGRLKDLQTGAHPVAEMAMRTEAARLMVNAVAAVYDEGAPARAPARGDGEAAGDRDGPAYVVDAAVQLHGGPAPLRRRHAISSTLQPAGCAPASISASEVQWAGHCRGADASVEAL